MSMRNKFDKIAREMRHVIPDVDEPFWNFYRNVFSPERVTPIKIPVEFFRQGKVVAAADFVTLPSSVQLAALALDRVARAHPRLDWDQAKVNYGRFYTRDELAEVLKAHPILVETRAPARSSFDMATQFFKAVRAIDVKNGAVADVAAAYNHATDRLALQIASAAYDVQWKTGGPNLIDRIFRRTP